MNSLRYTKCQSLSLRSHAEFSEQWLQDRIAEDPSILGLGDVDVIAREHRQDKAGRLDLLLIDRKRNTRYEVELMLGPTDESHIIRAIEYWDIERRRFPGYDHCAVLVAEDITSRFLNILSLFAGTIPFIAIQLSALQINDQIVLNFVRVLDRISLRRDDESEATVSRADRKYWIERSSEKVVGIVDAIVQLVNERAKGGFGANYVRSYIGIQEGGRGRNIAQSRNMRHLKAARSAIPSLAATAYTGGHAADRRSKAVALEQETVPASAGCVWRRPAPGRAG